jgi:hypothetical protein
MSSILYCNLEDTKRALDVAETARSDAQVLRAIESGARSIEGLTHRRFYPWTGTRYFPWPHSRYRSAFRLWLDADELISLTTLVAGGVTIPAADYFLEPVNTGPPFTSIEIDLGSNAAFSSGSTWQRAIAATGVFGHSADEAPAGALAGAISSTTATSAGVTDSSLIGVGTIIRVEGERMNVTAKAMVSTGQTSSALTASSSDETITGISAGTIKAGEVLLVDAERMLVVDVAGTTLTVKRAWDGSTLASHSAGAAIFAPRTLTVERGALGTTAATHLDATAVVKHVVPALVRDLNIAEAINQLQLETSGYARIIGEGENAREGTGRSLFDLRRDTITAYGRQARSRAV